ncbi:MAG: hypothetical protein Q7K35_00060 [bacterium]|nr:hypothetical protein [bacterium]
MKRRTSQYAKLGVDAAKANVWRIFGRIVHNDFPGAFVNIARDPETLGGVFTMHADGDGSKFVQRALHYLETGDQQVFRGAVDNAFSMNTGDIAASGFVFERWVLTQILNINGLNVPKELIMEQIALRVESLLKLYRSYGFKMTYFMGGETADLPDQVNSAVYDVAVYAEAQEMDLIKGNVKPGDVIYGFASDGQATWEMTPNFGIMANGLSLGRICTMRRSYGLKYPFLSRRKNVYRGRFGVRDNFDSLNVSQALMSPTRQWAILIRVLIDKLKREGLFHMLHGISMNTGGGATKIAHVGNGIIYIKKMPNPPPIFRLIKRESRETWRNMFQTFNCGVGIDVVGENDPDFRRVLKKVGWETCVKMFELGFCYPNSSRKNRVSLDTPFGKFDDY